MAVRRRSNTNSRHLSFDFRAASRGSRPLLSSHAFSLDSGTLCEVVVLISTVRSSTPSSPIISVSRICFNPAAAASKTVLAKTATECPNSALIDKAHLALSNRHRNRRLGIFAFCSLLRRRNLCLETHVQKQSAEHPFKGVANFVATLWPQPFGKDQ